MIKLPKKYHKKGKTFYYVHQNKWNPVGKELHDVYVHAAKVTASAEIDNMSVAIEKYRIEVLPKLAKSTQYNYGLMLEKIDAVFGHMDPKFIEHEHVCQFHEKLSKKAPVSANRHIEVLSALYKRLRRWCGCKENPCIGIIHNSEKPDKRYITHYELEIAHRVASPRDKLIIGMLYYSGQRLNDVLKMEWTHLNEIGIDVDQGKTESALTVKWSPGLRSIIAGAKELRGDRISRWIFPAEGLGKLTVNGFQSDWKRLMNRAEKEARQHPEAVFERFNIRQIRAKARTDGKDKYLLGHADPDKMDRVYYRKRRVVEPVA